MQTISIDLANITCAINASHVAFDAYDLPQIVDPSYVSPGRLLFLATFFSVIFTTIAIGYVEVTYRGLRYFYRKGSLRRYFPLTADRELARNFIGAGSFISPTTFTYFYCCYDPARPISFAFKPLEILFFSALYMVCHDQWFYHVHVHSHKDLWLYNTLHKMHHDYTHELNVFCTAYGTICENLIDVGFGWMFNVVLVNYLGYMNFWTLIFPFTFATLTTILGHSGYATAPHFALFHPLMIAIRPFAKQMLTPNDHHAHHLYRRCNYGLFFRFNDQFYGTYKRSPLKAYDVHYWSQKFKDGETPKGKLAPDHKGPRIALPYEETGWGF